MWGDVAIPYGFRKVQEIATPVCGLARDDMRYNWYHKHKFISSANKNCHPFGWQLEGQFLTGQDFGLDHTGELTQLAQQFFQGDGHIHGLSRNGQNSGTVGGNNGIDG